MEKIFDPGAFKPDALAKSLEAEIGREFQDSLLPVNLLTTITYEPRPDGRLVITDCHMVEEHPFVWGFVDFAPFYMRLRVYLTHWLEVIHADIIEVRIASDQFEEVVTAKSGVEEWMNTDKPLLIN